MGQLDDHMPDPFGGGLDDTEFMQVILFAVIRRPMWILIIETSLFEINVAKPYVGQTFFSLTGYG